MKRYFRFVITIAFIVGLSVSLSSCIEGFILYEIIKPKSSSYDDPLLIGSWDKMNDFDGSSRSKAVSFVIGDYAFVGTGYHAETNQYLNDFWRYDAASNTWKQAADFPGTARHSAIAFTLNGKGYVGTGTSDGENTLNDFYEFDPDASEIGQWKEIANFDGVARYGAIAFTVKNRAFVCSGIDGNTNELNDLWEYDQTNNTWIQKSDMVGTKRYYGFVMTVNDYAYVGGGINSDTLVTDFYRFDVDQVDNGTPWKKLNGFTGKDANGNAIVQPWPRYQTSTFTIGNYGYLTCGNVRDPVGDTWQYDPTTDTWIQYFSFNSNQPVAGSPRAGAVAFSLNDYGYLVGGEVGNAKTLRDFWKFDPQGMEQDNK